MHQHDIKPSLPSAAPSRYLPSPVRTMQQPVSSLASPVFIATPTGRSSLFAPSKEVLFTPIFSPTYAICVGEKPTGAFGPPLREISPTSVSSPLAMPSVWGTSAPRIAAGGLVGIRLNYDHRSPSHEMIFEPTNRSPRRVHVLCPPRDKDNTVKDTASDSPPKLAASTSSFKPLSKMSSSSSITSTHNSSHKRSRASTMSPASPTPQNLKDNPERLAKVKTEMCRYYELGGIQNCPWGDACNYAHGKHELKFNYSTLTLMESSGQIVDAKTHLSRPCMTWISTGACPFGRRCTAIHDPSITGPLENPSWLPVASAKTNAQIIVDRFAHYRDSVVHQENPLIAQGIWEHCRPSLRGNKKSTSQCDTDIDIGWMDTYALVCNIGLPSFGSWERASTTNNAIFTSSTRSSSKKLSELQKLCIVSYMRGQESTFSTSEGSQLHQLHRDYTYAPTHSLHSELCMVLQTRYFILINENAENFIASAAATNKRNFVEEISHAEYKSRATPWSSDYRFNQNRVIMATEVAFAPKGEYNANVSIWFDAKPIQLEPSQIKRCRRIKQKNKAQIKNDHRAPHSNGALLCRTSIVDFPSRAPDIDPFVPMLPAEDGDESERFMLAIIEHRIDCLVDEKLSRNGVGAALRKKDIDDRMKALEDTFTGINRFHRKWLWPKRVGSEVVDESTLAPPANCMPYIPSRSCKGSTCVSVWDSFVVSITGSTTHPKIKRNEMGRLKTFQTLGNELPVSNGLNPFMPRIKPSLEESDSSKENVWKEVVLGADGKWKNACRLYNDTRGTSPSNIDAHNMPLSTIPFVPPQG